MILTCPNCATRYEADAAKFLPAGRKVRCAKCGHMWHQPAPAAEADEPEITTAASVETPASVAVEQPAAASAAETQSMRPSVVTPLAPRKTVAAGWRMGALTGWAALIAVLALLGWVAIAFRQGIVTVWPKTATFYAAAGMQVNTVGLAFEDVSYRITSEDDMPVLHIKGKVVNITQRELSVPPISAALTDDARRELYDWKIAADAKTLGPGKAASFSARVPSPPSGARHVDLKFVKG
jgi:predicted Zn finger-like uncharacterized protein